MKICLRRRFLCLGYNNLQGSVPEWITTFTSLQVLDLCNNNFNGRIPFNLERLKGFRVNSSSDLGIDVLYEDLTLQMKGSESTLKYVLSTNTILDLSSNHLTGEIPTSIGSQSGMRLLNLSNNQLEGQIPPSLSNISALEQLNLDKNNLTGRIPQELSQLFGLGVFNVSSNNLCGPIPKGTQFSTFNKSSFERNKCLCGLPLPPCQVEVVSGSMRGINGDKSGNKVGWLKHVDENISLRALRMGLGIGFGGVITMFIIWKRARNWVIPTIKPQQFYGMYRFPK